MNRFRRSAGNDTKVDSPGTHVLPPLIRLLTMFVNTGIQIAHRRTRKEGEKMLITDSSRNLGQEPHFSSFGNRAIARNRRIGHRLWFLALIMIVCSTAAARGQQYFYVDCSGANPNDYPTISSALPFTGPGSIVLVTGTCTENVAINSAFNLNIGAWYGQTANIVGSVTVFGSDSVYLYGLNATNPAGNGFNINNSHAVTLDTCTGNGNQLYGLSASGGSDVTVQGPSAFDNNGSQGINLGSNAIFTINSWGGPTDISNNKGPGVWGTGGSVFWTQGSTTIENNANLPGVTPLTAYGIQLYGASKAQLGTCFGPNVIQGNQAGGINSQENSEVSLWNCGFPYESYVLDNGPVGISAGLGSQVTLDNNVQISGHSGPGVEIWGHSQLNIIETNLISKNGTAGDPRSAGVVVDGNSEAYLRGGQISMNDGPGMLVLVNSSVDFSGATFTGNSGGAITCDSSAYMVSDPSATADRPRAGINCRIPHNLGNRRGSWGGRPAALDFTAQNNKHAWYKSKASPKP
jgi:hypothetical protein